MGYKLTGVYIRPNGTEQKIRPTGFTPSAVIDFTQSDYGFTHYGGIHEWSGQYGYDSSGLWATNYWQAGTIWSGLNQYSSIPLNRIEIDFTTETRNRSGVGLCVGSDSEVLRIWQQLDTHLTGFTDQVIYPFNNGLGSFTYVLDLEDGEMYSTSDPSTKITLTSSECDYIKSNRSDGSWNICAMFGDTDWNTTGKVTITEIRIY